MTGMNNIVIAGPSHESLTNMCRVLDNSDTSALCIPTRVSTVYSFHNFNQPSLLWRPCWISERLDWNSKEAKYRRGMARARDCRLETSLWKATPGAPPELPRLPAPRRGWSATFARKMAFGRRRAQVKKSSRSRA